MFGLDAFKRSNLGVRVGAILEDPQVVGDMIAFSRHQMPAVQAAGKRLASLGPEVSQDQVKKTIGRWVREILEQQGFTVWKNRRVAPGNLFSTGMVYRPKTSETTPNGGPAPLSGAERAAAWRDGVKDLPHSEPLSDDAIERETIYADRG